MGSPLPFLCNLCCVFSPMWCSNICFFFQKHWPPNHTFYLHWTSWEAVVIIFLWDKNPLSFAQTGLIEKFPCNMHYKKHFRKVCTKMSVLAVIPHSIGTWFPLTLSRLFPQIVRNCLICGFINSMSIIPWWNSVPLYPPETFTLHALTSLNDGICSSYCV